jgi:hypothetical protein
LVVGNKSVDTLIIGSLRHPAIRGNDLAQVRDNRATTGNIVDRNKSRKDKNKHHARNRAAVVNIAMTSAFKHGANHGHSDSLNTIIGDGLLLRIHGEARSNQDQLTRTRRGCQDEEQVEWQ